MLGQLQILTNDKNLLSDPNNAGSAVGSVQLTALENKHDKLAEYLQASLSNNSKRAYLSDIQHFLNWGGKIPATSDVVAQYLVAHAESLSNATLSRRLVSIGRAHTSQGFAAPTKSELVKATLHGIRRVHGTAQHQVSPILKADIIAMVENLNGLIGLRNRALLLVGFAGAFRRSELVAVNCTDVSFVEQGMIVHIRRSKSDQTGHGRKIAIPYARGKCCPVFALKEWLAASQISSGAIFRPVTKHGLIQECALSPDAVAHVVKQRALAAGLDPSNYSGHSLRSGLVTSAAQAGVSANKILQQTGHRSLDMMTRYIRDANIFVDNAAGAVL
ncbi:MAG: site-specific integrase [Pseudomonadota bacterium]